MEGGSRPLLVCFEVVVYSSPHTGVCADYRMQICGLLCQDEQFSNEVHMAVNLAPTRLYEEEEMEVCVEECVAKNVNATLLDGYIEQCGVFYDPTGQ